MKEYEKNWYVLFVLGGREQVLCDYFNRNDDLNTFVLKKEMFHKKQGKIFPVLKPMFPSYIFIETKLEHKEFQQVLMRARNERDGIIKELKYGDEVPSLQPEERRYLEGLLDDKRVVKASQGYMENDKVVILDGPLKGYESNIVKIDRHRRKAELEIRILDNTLNVNVSLEIIKKI